MIGRTVLNAWRSKATPSVSSSSSPSSNLVKHCQLLVVGGGSGGLGATAILGNKFKTIVVEPGDFHYYQPYFTFVGVGLKQLNECRLPMRKVIPLYAQWIKESVSSFEPIQDLVITDSGTIIKYDILIVATGIYPAFSKIPGLIEALKTPNVGSNYTPETVTKTFSALRNFKHGNAVFTYPSTPIKCPGAPQKAVYLSDEYLRKQGKRDKANLIYNTASEVLFGVKKYADSLWQVANKKGIKVNLHHKLVQVEPGQQKAIFEQTQGDVKKRVSVDYEMLHVTPPMFPVEATAKSPLADSAGFVDINRRTLQHNTFKNVFAIGDCTAHLPKTAAAVAASLAILDENVRAFNSGKDIKAYYNGYTSCPLTTGFNKCILAGTSKHNPPDNRSSSCVQNGREIDRALIRRSSQNDGIPPTQSVVNKITVVYVIV
ncbi:sulfide:quinone oxidoreductase, mitochondrial-like isoform X2 [Varroa jacobsoni]|uniref:sulfide:quinone oxidoreductase, mitochondrial-like isoform X2 n=1 Tax=Varroa jacobsoni TaxID=62625 RepID=UPI000BF599D0|nr:sulfide:quinone oxidoreductase, mitochondrial-like isoform X2 [Varroa jacobsoni]